MGRISGAPPLAGNSARLLIDGPASYEVIFREIRAARDHVNVETYIFEADEVGQSLAALLIEKQTQGVQVNVLYDAVGSLGTPAEFFDRMRASGINVCAFNPLLPERGRSANPNQRDHASR
jgi:cardiolipin synthase